MLLFDPIYKVEPIYTQSVGMIAQIGFVAFHALEPVSTMSVKWSILFVLLIFYIFPRLSAKWR